MPSPPGPQQVTSVNGKRGDVKLTAKDVGVDVAEQPASVNGLRFGRGSASNDRAATSSDIPHLPANKINSGVFDAARLGTGAVRDGTKILHDNGTWQDESSGGASASTAPQAGDGSGGFVDATAAGVVALFTGTPTGSLFLRDDGTLAAAAGGGSSVGTGVQKGDGAGGFAAAVLADILAAIGTQSANLILAGPVSGGAATSAFRALVWADISALAGSSSTTFAIGNDTRFPASVTGLRKGAGAGSADTAATAADVTTLAAGTSGTTLAVGNDTRFPASVTGLRKGAGAGSADTAASASDILTALGTQTANRVLAGPVSGGAATPTFRAIVFADIPPVVTVSINCFNYQNFI